MLGAVPVWWLLTVFYAERLPTAGFGWLGALEAIAAAEWPERLLSALIGADPTPGRFVLAGSSQFELIESVTQSLAGRTALLTLHPFALGELQAAKRGPQTLSDLLGAVTT